MARLLIKTRGLENQTLELRFGTNHVGRDSDCDFPIDHPTVSSNHCELVLSSEGVMLRDCGSTNGTFVNGDHVKETWLLPGQTVHLGDVGEAWCGFTVWWDSRFSWAWGPESAVSGFLSQDGVQVWQVKYS